MNISSEVSGLPSEATSLFWETPGIESALKTQQLLIEGRYFDALDSFVEQNTPSLIELLVKIQLCCITGDRPGARQALVEFSHLCQYPHINHQVGACLEFSLGYLEASAIHDETVVSLLPLSQGTRFMLRAARRRAANGELTKGAEGAITWLHFNTGYMPECIRAVKIILDSGQFSKAQELLLELHQRFPDSHHPLIAMGQLSLWTGDYSRARNLAIRAQKLSSGSVDPSRILGVVAVNLGDLEAGVTHLSRVLEVDPQNVEARIWRIVAYTHLEAWESANEDIRANLFADGSLAAFLTRMWSYMFQVSRSLKMSLFHTPIIRAKHRDIRERLAAVQNGPRWPITGNNHQDLLILLSNLLKHFRGNRSNRLTFNSEEPDLFIEPDQNTVHWDTLQYLPACRSPREEASDTLRTVAQIGPEQTRLALEQLTRAHPCSPQPWCYWGELELWLGNLDQAISLFKEGNQRYPARWAYIGMAAIHYLRGHFWKARFKLFELRKHYRPLEGSTLRVYRGEGRRRAGAYRLAISDLQQAVRIKPTRVGARINLVLSLVSSGRLEEAKKEFIQVVSHGPGILWAAGQSKQELKWDRTKVSTCEPILEQVLIMMRGNRSSTQVTYFTPAGDLRIPVSTNRVFELSRELGSIISELKELS